MDHGDTRQRVDGVVPDLVGLGRFVRERRRALGLTQRELGARIDWVQERVSLLERAGYGLPSLIILARLAAGLEVPLSSVLGALGYPTDSPTLTHEPSRSTALLYTLESFLALSAGTVPSLLAQSCDVAAQVMGADIVEVYHYDETGGRLRSRGYSTTPLAQRELELGLDQLRTGRTVEVFITGQPYATGAAHRDGRTKFYTSAGIESLLVAPIEVAGARIGVLVAGSHQIDRFSKEEEHFFLAMARWIGLIAHRAWLTGPSSPESIAG